MPRKFAELKNKIDFETQGIKSVLENFNSGEAFVDLIVESVNSQKDKKDHYSKEDWLLEGMMRRIGDALTMLEFSQDFALCEKIMDFAKSKNLFSDNSIWELGVMHFLSSGGDLSSIQKIFHREEFSTFQKLMNGTQNMEEKAKIFHEFLACNVKPNVSQNFLDFTYEDWGFVKRILTESEKELKEIPALQRETFLKRISGMLQVCPLAPNDFILPKEKRDLLFDTFNQEVGSLKTAWCWEQKQIDAFMPVFEKNMIKAVALDEKVETSKPRFTKI